MGNKPSSAKVSTVDNQAVINQDDVNIANQDIVNDVANTVINNASSCGASAVGSQIVTLNNLTAAQDININATQQNQVQLNFSCTQASALRQQIANDLFSQMMNDLTNSNNAETMSQLDAAAKASLTNGFGSVGAGGSKSNTNTNINFTNTTNTNTNLQTVLQKSITNNFSSEDIQTCNATLAGDQVVAANDLQAGRNINFTVNQTQSLAAYQECKQMQEAANDITGSIASGLGISILNQSEVKSLAQAQSSAAAQQVANGPLESAGNLAAGIGQGLGSAASGVGGGLGKVASGVGSGIGNIFGSINPLYCIICCVVLLIILAVVGYVLNKKADKYMNSK